MTGCRPDFLAAFVEGFRRNGWEFVSMDDVTRRIGRAGAGRPFAALTFDDGYRDTLARAVPILERLQVPFAVYVPTGAVTHDLYAWWLGLRALFRSRDEVAIDCMNARFSCADLAGMRAGLKAVTNWVASDHRRALELAPTFSKHAISMQALNESYFLGERGLHQLAGCHLATVGAHTSTHAALTTLEAHQARAEMADNKAFVERLLDRRVKHFAYPYGAHGKRDEELARDVGFATAVTTVPTPVYTQHRRTPYALPRVSVRSREKASGLFYRASGLGQNLHPRARRPCRALKASQLEFQAIDGAEQQRHALALLNEGFPDVAFDWSLAFRAPPGQGGHGLLLFDDGAPEGVMMSFERTRRIGGHERRVVNLASWYIRPKYRRFAVRMARMASADPDAIYTTGSATRATQTICLRTGFRYVTKGSILSVPLLNGLAAGRGIRIEPADPALAAPEDRQWISDHSDPRFIALSVRQGERVAPLLWMHGPKPKRYPSVRLIFAADLSLLRAALPALHARMLRRHGVVGLYLPQVPPLAGLRSARNPQKGPSLLVKGDVADTDVDLRYSEFLYLPLATAALGQRTWRDLFRRAGAGS